MYFYVEYEEQAGSVKKIRTWIVEGDHDWPEQIFTGPDVVKQLRAWAAQYPYVDGFSTRNILDPEEMEKVCRMLMLKGS